jgi:hypothetical protein
MSATDDSGAPQDDDVLTVEQAAKFLLALSGSVNPEASILRVIRSS